jgi:tetratricopeptide (TPR) repeat protein
VPDRLITLEIGDAVDSGARFFLYHLRFDGISVVNNESLSPSQSDHIRDIGETYSALFLTSGPTQAAAILVNARLKAMGAELFATWLEPHWQKLPVNPGDRRILIIASTLPDVLNLPWELLHLPDQEDICTDTGWGIRRTPWLNRKPATSDLTAGRLRVLFAACSPRDVKPELDYEREEELLSGAVGPDTRLDIAILGTFDELMDRVEKFQPHIVHLSGHGTLSNEGAAFFFEDGFGNSAPQFAKDLGRRFAGSGVKCVFVSGCQTGSAPARDAAAGLCQAIIFEGVPMAVGWGAPIDDETATIIAARFYRSAAQGSDVDFALARARWLGKSAIGGKGDASWSLPVLYSVTTDTRLFDKDAPPSSVPPNNELRPLPGMLQGHARNLVGRRRDMQAILPKLQQGELRGVVLTGMGGSGKSSLATRLARKLEVESQLAPIAISSAPHTPLKAQALLDACATAFLKAKQTDARKRASDNTLSVKERLRVLVGDLSEGFVLVIDNFENSLDEATRAIQDPEISDFYIQLLNELIGTSRVIITSRYLPAAVDPLPEDIVERGLGELSDIAFLKFMFREATVKQRYRTDATRRKTLASLHSRLGGIPRLAQQVRQELKAIDPDALQIEIDQNATPVNANGPLRRLDIKHEEFCAEMLIGRHHGRLSSEFKKILVRLAAYVEPIGVDGLAAISGSTITEVQNALKAFCRSALIHGDSHPENPTWSASGTLRRWLLDPSRSSAAEWQSAYRAAADRLVELDTARSGGKLVRSDINWLLRARSLYLASGATAEARKVTYRLSEILARRGDYAEVERLNCELIDPSSSSRSGIPHPDPATWIARAHLDRSDYPKAREWYQRALQLSDGFPLERAQALQGLATIDMRNSNAKAGREKFLEALKLQESIGDLLGQSLTWHQLGSIAMNGGDYDKARSNFAKALELLRELREQREPTVDSMKLEQAQEGEQAILHQFGSMELEENNIDKARTTLGAAWAIAQQLGERGAEAAAIHQLGRLEAKLGNFDNAWRMLKTALEIRRTIGDRAGEKKTLSRMGEIAAQLGKPSLQLDLDIIGYVISKAAIKGDAKSDLDKVNQLAASLGIEPGKLESTIADVEQKYLSDRGQGLLRQLYALRGPPSLKSN